LEEEVMSYDNTFTAVTGATFTAAQYNTYDRDNRAALFSKIEGLYPVGTIYESIVSTNPGTLFGFGTWAAFGAGKVLVGLDATDANFDTAEETGGAKTHTLSVGEIPAHTHTQANASTAGAQDGAASRAYSGNAATGSTGGGSAHNNLQPYIVVYRWKRTA
jgi:microcystin-dependent protein